MEAFEKRLKWLMALRAVFALFLFGSTIFFQFRHVSHTSLSLLLLYGISGVIFALSVAYAILMSIIRRKVAFAYFQIIADTLIVTAIIYVTGCYASVFSFLYLIVIMGACFFLRRKGGMIVAALCSIQYGIMLDLEYYGLLTPLDVAGIFAVSYLGGPQVLYKMVITIIACFGVAFLTSLLVEQEQKARQELGVMRRHVHRVEHMAAIGEMAAGLAHEIKNPLAALTGAIQMLNTSSSSTTDDDRLMRIIQREAGRLNSLVTNFLLFARPQKGRVKKIALDAVVSETLELFEKGLQERGNINCEAEVPENIWVEMDPEYLSQILWNLLLNAADAIQETEDGQGTINVKIFTAGNRTVKVEIRDDGCGMPREKADAVFDPFFTTKPRGTGLGLSVVHRLVESYGGRIDFESTPGAGTRFILTLQQSPP
ncbi:MAG: ATP-binding protein [Thermodesulfobacteriota bacterium]|nr:ATP-binding protein [Thermodesulfobacteriota bacterium]